MKWYFRSIAPTTYKQKIEIIRTDGRVSFYLLLIGFFFFKTRTISLCILERGIYEVVFPLDSTHHKQKIEIIRQKIEIIRTDGRVSFLSTINRLLFFEDSNDIVDDIITSYSMYP